MCAYFQSQFYLQLVKYLHGMKICMSSRNDRHIIWHNHLTSIFFYKVLEKINEPLISYVRFWFLRLLFRSEARGNTITVRQQQKCGSSNPRTLSEINYLHFLSDLFVIISLCTIS